LRASESPHRLSSHTRSTTSPYKCPRSALQLPCKRHLDSTCCVELAFKRHLSFIWPSKLAFKRHLNAPQALPSVSNPSKSVIGSSKFEILTSLQLKSSWTALWQFFGPSWTPFGPHLESWGVFARFWAALGRSWAPLGPNL